MQVISLLRWVVAGALLFLYGQVAAQLTIRVTAIPINTPAGSNIYIAGNFNTWNAGDPNAILSLNNGVYSITINPAPGQLEFKFTRGSWATVEGNMNGGFLPNRMVSYSGAPQTLDLTILSWEDVGGTNSTAAPNVQIMDNNFYMPQLNRYRRIWLYLPPDYHTSNKNYPVLYMHDGQNLFDDATSFSGEWHVDEALNTLHSQGDYGCIVVGIENGGQYRLDEYSPWVNTQYGGGQGEEYLNFIVNTLKPHIDANYRTFSGRTSTGIMGSSMGGLISMYGFSERQDVFSRSGIFSPAFWFAGSNSANHTATHDKQGSARVYFLAGGSEPAYVATDMQAVADAMGTAGFSADEKYSTVVPGGQHSEWFWAQEFPDAYVWLFAGAVSSVLDAGKKRTLDIYPNPVGDWLRFGRIEEDVDWHIQVMGMDGMLKIDTIQSATLPLNTSQLPAGAYLVKVKAGDKRRLSGKFIKQ